MTFEDVERFFAGLEGTFSIVLRPLNAPADRWVAVHSTPPGHAVRSWSGPDPLSAAILLMHDMESLT